MICKSIKNLAAATVAVMVMAGGVWAQGDTAYVPFRVSVDAKVTAVSGVDSVSISVTGGEVDTLKLPLGGNVSVLNPNGTRGQLNAPAITRSRGNINLRLPAQSYQKAEIFLYSVNGRRILRGKADASNAASGILRQNVVAGVYLLSVKGINGNVFTNRLTHSGGKMNINVGFGGQSVSPDRRLGKRADAKDGDWEITVTAIAAGYADSEYTLKVVSGYNNQTQNIILKGIFTDNRDGKTYKKVAIGTQVWMAENLNYRNSTGSSDTVGACYKNSADSCAKYGRLYSWDTAMDGAESSEFNPSGVRGVCPVGWHLPSDAEWTTLTDFVGGASTAGGKLKSTSGWYNNDIGGLSQKVCKPTTRC